MQHIFDMIIIGGGPAGYTAALYAARAGLDFVLLEKLSAGGQMALTGDIDNYPGFEQGIDGYTLGIRMQQTAERFGARTEYAEVKEVSFSGEIKKLITSKQEFLSRTVIIATGAAPRRLNIKNEAELVGKGIHYCAHCDGRFYKDKTVAVVGGGNSALADALYLSKLAKKVYLIHRRDTFRADGIYQKALPESKNIELVLNSSVAELISDGRITGVAVKSTSGQSRELSVDGVFISIGRRPITEFLGSDIELDEDGYIMADESTKTNIKGVFAAGDVRTKTLRQVITAAADGAVAVHSAQQYLTNKS